MSTATWNSTMPRMTDRPALARAYRLTRYVVGEVEIRIGRRCPALPEATLIGAWNPGSRRLPEGRNRRLHANLLAAARRLPTEAASGGLGRWREEHLLVRGDPRPALRLARRFRQRAVLRWRRGQAARILWL
jgi:hypothetical protein